MKIKIHTARSKADQCPLNLPHLREEKPISRPGNREVCPWMIYDWKTLVEMICGKGFFGIGNISQ